MGQVPDDTDTQAAYAEVIAADDLNANESTAASDDDSEGTAADEVR